MEDSKRVQVLHAGGDVSRQRDPKRLRQRLRPEDQLLQRTALHVLRECVELTLVHAHTHESGRRQTIISPFTKDPMKVAVSPDGELSYKRGTYKDLVCCDASIIIPYCVTMIVK